MSIRSRTLWPSLVLGVAVCGFWWHQTHQLPVQPTRDAATPQAVEPSLRITGREPAAQKTAAAMAVALPEPERAKQVKAILKLNSCFETEACDFPKTDPASYGLAVDHEISRLLKDFLKNYRGDLAAQLDLLKLGQTYIRTPFGFSQEAALEILSSLPPSKEDLDALADGLGQSPDATLVHQALPELKRYLGTPWENQVHSLLGSTLTSGPHFSSQEIANSILPFINEKSYPLYYQTWESMPESSRASRTLSSALQEYQRLKTGA